MCLSLLNKVIKSKSTISSTRRLWPAVAEYAFRYVLRKAFHSFFFHFFLLRDNNNNNTIITVFI